MRALAVTLVVAFGSGGCRRDASTSADLSVGSSDQLTLTVGAARRPMVALYSFYVAPLADMPSEQGAFLVVTAIDPAFDCAHPTTGLDSLSFLFQSRAVGSTSATIFGRHGPDFASTVGGGGMATIDADDDRLMSWDVDAGTVSAGDGSVGGRMHFAVGNLALDGRFVAARCAALDFLVGG